MCGTTFDAQDGAPEREPSVNAVMIGVLAVIVAVCALAFYWFATNQTVQSSTLTAGETEMDFVCVPVDDHQAMRKLERTGWTRSTGGFVSDDNRGKKCFWKKR